MKKLISIIILINIIIFSMSGIFLSKSYGKQYISSDINGINDRKYPDIKSMIKKVEKQHPNWDIKVFYTGLDWNDVIRNEHKKHGANLVPVRFYTGQWICSECGNKEYDSGWHCSSEEGLEYMIDPRNSLNETDIFQFMQLSYMDCSYKDLKQMVKKCDYLNDDNLLKDIVNIGKEYDVNPYYIVAKIIQEQGTNGTSPLANGKRYVGTDGVTYSGYYNLFNYRASGTGSAKIITNGLKYAKSQGWDSMEKSIEGGVSKLALNYIKNGQNTMYFEKYNVSSTKYKLYDHQYMQNILGAQNEGTHLRKGLVNAGALDGKYTFIIPLYENMPSSAAKVPSRTGKSNYTYKDNTRDDNDNNEKQNSDNNKNDSPSYRLGDINNDGKINSGDLLLLKRHLLGTAKISDKNKLLAMDVNKDDRINSGDLLLIKKHLLGTYKITN